MARGIAVHNANVASRQERMQVCGIWNAVGVRGSVVAQPGVACGDTQAVVSVAVGDARFGMLRAVMMVAVIRWYPSPLATHDSGFAECQSV